MVHYANRKMIVQRNFDIASVRVFGVIGILQERDWWGSLQGFIGTVEQVIKNFMQILLMICWILNLVCLEKSICVAIVFLSMSKTLHLLWVFPLGLSRMMLR